MRLQCCFEMLLHKFDEKRLCSRRRDDPRRFCEDPRLRSIKSAPSKSRLSPIIIGGSRGNMLVYRAELAEDGLRLGC